MPPPTNSRLRSLFVPAHRADQPRAIPHLYAGISRLLVEQQYGHLARIFVRRQIDIMRL